MYLKRLELSGFKSFAKHIKLDFPVFITAIVGPNGSGKSNVAEAIRWVLGEQSIKSLRGKKGKDLIFNGSQTAPRLSKAAVSLFFNNEKKLFPLDYDEVKITRKVFRDSTNDYLINDSKVRFRDIMELLSKIGIGPSSHNIISQGESDRILNASLKERRQMIEEALGLRIYQLKKTEAEKKLEKTEENMNQVETLRKEIQPHLKFLKKQVEKAEQVLSLKDKLKALYTEYLFREKKYLESEEEKTRKEKIEIEKSFLQIDKKFSSSRGDSNTLKLKIEIDNQKKEAEEIESAISALRQKRNSAERELGRFEGMIEALSAKKFGEKEKIIPSSEIKYFLEEIEAGIKKSLSVSSLEEIKEAIKAVEKIIKNFAKKLESGSVLPPKELKEIKIKQEETRNILARLESEEGERQKKLDALENIIGQKEGALRALEKENYETELKLKELKGNLENINIKEENLKIQKEEMEREIKEARALAGDLSMTESFSLETEGGSWLAEKPSKQREIEKLKIKLEDSGAVNEEVIKEYEEVKKRDEFFEKELADLGQAIKSLKDMLKDLEEKIDHDFKAGLEKINTEFQAFFTAMFGGGKAELKRVIPKKRLKKEEEENLTLEEAVEEMEEGIDVYVNLPKKKINSLDMLSGGERALTSIALLFAMTQVNPPPFLVLDETDAALDEANSQKYGKILKDLSTKTQLILITHNRETMRQADVLYGVTMGADSISRLLSIKLTEAEQYTST